MEDRRERRVCDMSVEMRMREFVASHSLKLQYHNMLQSQYNFCASTVESLCILKRRHDE